MVAAQSDEQRLTRIDTPPAPVVTVPSTTTSPPGKGQVAVPIGAPPPLHYYVPQAPRPMAHPTHRAEHAAPTTHYATPDVPPMSGDSEVMGLPPLGSAQRTTGLGPAPIVSASLPSGPLKAGSVIVAQGPAPPAEVGEPSGDAVAQAMSIVDSWTDQQAKEVLRLAVRHGFVGSGFLQFFEDLAVGTTSRPSS